MTYNNYGTGITTLDFILGDNTALSIPVDINDNERHEITAMWEGGASGTKKLYLDGNYLGQDTYTNFGALNYYFELGSLNSGVGTFFKGDIQQVRMYNRQLSTREVGTLV
ncbi:MAG: LamG-like jellyroll fold domain-containing protein [bacterium]|nr:LamG-like jellyroll fold domain-containing protein [bacterium]